MSQTAQKQISMLIVDDDSASRKLLQLAIGKSSLDCTAIEAAESIEATLERLQGAKFDVILLDLNLPGSYGSQTLTTVVKAQPTAAIVIVSGLDGDDLDALEIGEQAQGRLSKGKFDITVLEKTIMRAFEKKREQDQK